MTEAHEDTSAGWRIGYARCSTDKQDLRAQKAELGKLSPDQVFTDEGFSGSKRDSRRGLDQALAALRAGDTLVVTKLDRLARSVPDARAIAAEVEAKGARIQLGSMVYDPNDPMGRMFFNMLATFAEFEADISRMRTREGMAQAKADGKLKGKPPKLTPAQDREVRRMRDSGDYRIGEIAELFTVTRPTIYRSLERTDPLATAEHHDHDPGQHSSPSPTRSQRQPASTTASAPTGEKPAARQTEHTAPTTPAPEPEQDTAASTRHHPRSRKQRSSPAGRKRRYTGAELNAYQLEPVRGAAGDIQHYTVLVAGDTLGYIDRAPYGHTGWQAHHPAGSTVAHSGRGRYAKTRETAVIDLLLALGITTR